LWYKLGNRFSQNYYYNISYNFKRFFVIDEFKFNTLHMYYRETHFKFQHSISIVLQSAEARTVTWLPFLNFFYLTDGATNISILFYHWIFRKHGFSYCKTMLLTQVHSFILFIACSLKKILFTKVYEIILDVWIKYFGFLILEIFRLFIKKKKYLIII